MTLSAENEDTCTSLNSKDAVRLSEILPTKAVK